MQTTLGHRHFSLYSSSVRVGLQRHIGSPEGNALIFLGLRFGKAPGSGPPDPGLPIIRCEVLYLTRNPENPRPLN